MPRAVLVDEPGTPCPAGLPLLDEPPPVVIDGAGVCLPELFPAQFAEAVTSFVAAA